MKMDVHVRQVSGDQSETVQKDALTKWRQDDDETNRVQEECCSVQKWKNYSKVFTFCQARSEQIQQNEVSEKRL
jgi:hypothetical protein